MKVVNKMENNPLEEIVDNVINESTIEQNNLNEDNLKEMFDEETIIENKFESGEDNGN